MKRKYYLIDTENVGDRWLNLPQKAGKKDRIISFYTQHHSNLLEKYLVKQVHNPKILWLECAAGNNALDYQLIGVLAYLIAKHPKASYCIYSNDTDYKDTVDFWKSRGIDICTKGCALAEKKKKEKKKQAAGKADTKKKQTVKKKKIKQAADESSREKKQAQKQEPSASDPMPALTAGDLKNKQLTKEQLVEEIARSIPASDLSSWYCAAVSILGMEYGREWYLNFKTDTQSRTKFSQYYNGNKKFRGVNLIAAALHANGLDTGGAEEAYKIVCSHGKTDLNGIKQDFDKAFQKELRQGYYKAVRPLIKVIKKVA